MRSSVLLQYIRFEAYLRSKVRLNSTTSIWGLWQHRERLFSGTHDDHLAQSLQDIEAQGPTPSISTFRFLSFFFFWRASARVTRGRERGQEKINSLKKVDWWIQPGRHPTHARARKSVGRYLLQPHHWTCTVSHRTQLGVSANVRQS